MHHSATRNANIISKTFLQGPTQCFVPGRCTQSIVIDIDFNTNSVNQCLHECKNNPECAWFSFDPDMNSCMLLSECNQLDTSNYGMGCAKCIRDYS